MTVLCLVELDGTEFQREVWAELSRIPYGETISYGELARRVGRPRGPRAVGQARACLAPLLQGLELAVRTATALPIEARGKFRVSKRHFPLDLARAFEGL